MRGLRLGSVLLSGIWLASCTLGGGGSDGTSPTHPKPLRPLGGSCTDGTDCESALCLKVSETQSVCTADCSTDADCVSTGGSGPYACGVGPGNRRLCVAPCGNLVAGYTCVDGLPTVCDIAGGNHCGDCGCSPGTRCLKDGACGPLATVGEACSTDDDCNTKNCSTYAGVCRTPIGQSCTTANCDVCYTLPSGWSYCSRTCSAEDQCNGGRCVSHQQFSRSGVCYPPCSGAIDPTCPTTCVGVTDGTHVCNCDTCTAETAPRKLGNVCDSSSQCESGLCYAGHCSGPCNSSVDCGGLACAQIPCAPGEQTTCGALCVPYCVYPRACDAGQDCWTLPTDSGDKDVCTEKKKDGEPCSDVAECQSARCIGGACASSATGPAQNGSACLNDTECVSSNCSNGTCRGTSLVGDPCKIEYDCAVGTCCSGTCC